MAVKAGAALVCGCTAIVKPSDETPLIALALAMGMLLALTRKRPGIASWRN